MLHQDKEIVENICRCSQRRCVLESPHYPGLYPRNLTCTYHIFVLPGEVPQGKQVSKQSLTKFLCL